MTGTGKNRQFSYPYPYPHFTRTRTRAGYPNPCSCLMTTLLNFSIALLTAGDMSISTGAGRLFITEALKAPWFGALLLGALAELSWGGWKLAAMPTLHQSTGDLLAASPKQTLPLFASLCHSNKLGEVDIIWRCTIDMWACERLSRWQLSPDGIGKLRNLLSLSAYVERMPASLIGIIQQMLDVPEPEALWNVSHANAGWVLWACMHSLAGLKDVLWRQQVDLAGWTRVVVQWWS